MNLNYFINQITIYLPNILKAFAILILFICSGNIINKILSNKIIKIHNNPTIINLIRKTIKSLFYIFGIISCLGTFGIDVSAMIAGLGLTGFALGFALKDTLSNLISGILVLIYRPFNINDAIIVDKYEGIVENINLRYTEIKQDNKKILIPNAFLFSKPITIKSKEKNEF